MKKALSAKLTLNRETLGFLEDAAPLRQVAGGYPTGREGTCSCKGC